MLKRKSALRNRKGLATLEIIPVMIVIALLINYSLGFFGIIHTGILNSMAARNYAMETFRNRTNLVYFHDVRGSTSSNYKKYNTRVHGIASETRGASSDASAAVATMRKVGFGESPKADTGTNGHESGGDRGIFAIKEGVRNTDVEAAPVWIRPTYGLCLNATCKEQ